MVVIVSLLAPPPRTVAQTGCGRIRRVPDDERSLDELTVHRARGVLDDAEVNDSQQWSEAEDRQRSEGPDLSPTPATGR